AMGGNLGQVTRGQTAGELETFFYNLVPGTLCPVPVPSRYGYHVLRLDRRELGQALPFDIVKNRIADYLRDRAWRRAVHQYIQILIGRATIEGVGLDGAASPLVQ
ncbi:MAG TPA: peptidylprolyl isomerase, partial [Azospirillaceae bacterium]|nr:peptidylprolyl isomerase [Azospirillaceae bacterium]